MWETQCHKQGIAVVTDVRFFWSVTFQVVNGFQCGASPQAPFAKVVAIVVSPVALVDPIPQVPVQESGLWILYIDLLGNINANQQSQGF